MSAVEILEKQNEYEKLRHLVRETIKEILCEDLAKILNEFLSLALKKQKYPDEIKGDKLAGELIGISAGAMRKRRESGWYQQGLHFKKERGTILWNKDALLNLKEIQNGS